MKGRIILPNTISEAPANGKTYGRKDKAWILVNPIQVTGITLLFASWILNGTTGLYEYNLANANITVNSIVEVIPENSTISTVIAAVILPETDSSAGSVKLYSTNAPAADISVSINIVEKQ